MSVATDSPITEALQSLIDARLDTIDRMLVGRVTRQDRLAIVREVESQVHDLLAERPAGEVDREAVLAVLARLDPPEAYLPDELGEVAGPSARPSGRRDPAPARPSPDPSDPRAKMGRVAGILGLVSIGLALLAPWPCLAGFLADSEILILLTLGPMLATVSICGILAVGFAAYARVRGSWAITGLVTGLISVLIAVISVAFFLIYGV